MKLGIGQKIVLGIAVLLLITAFIIEPVAILFLVVGIAYIFSGLVGGVELASIFEAAFSEWSLSRQELNHFILSMTISIGSVFLGYVYFPVYILDWTLLWLSSVFFGIAIWAFFTIILPTTMEFRSGLTKNEMYCLVTIFSIVGISCIRDPQSLVGVAMFFPLGVPSAFGGILLYTIFVTAFQEVALDKKYLFLFIGVLALSVVGALYIPYLSLFARIGIAVLSWVLGCVSQPVLTYIKTCSDQ